MSDIEKFIHEPKAPMPDLIKIALIHYQFETIHPFNDGNGRVGRLLVTLYLVSKGLLKRPVLYLSDYLERHRNEYFRRITTAHEENDIVGWIRFFLEGVIETAEKSVATFDEILRLEKTYELKVQAFGSRSANAMKVISEMYRSPITDGASITKLLGVTPTTAYTLLDKMVKAGILKEVIESKRGKKYVLCDYMMLFQK